MSKSNNISVLLNGIIKENPVLVLILGTCPTLATTNTVIAITISKDNKKYAIRVILPPLHQLSQWAYTRSFSVWQYATQQPYR